MERDLSKINLCLVTFGIIVGVIGILHGCAEILKGSILIEGHNVEALPFNWPNQEFYSMMKGAPGFSLLTKIPYYTLGLVAISVSITLIVCSLTIVNVSVFGVLIFSLLSIGIFCFGAGRGTPVVVCAPLVIFSILSMKMPKKRKSESGKKTTLRVFNFFYSLHIFS